MRNGGQPQQTAVMAPPHLNGSAQFVSGGYVGYVPRQSWGQFQGPQHHPRSTARPLSHPPPPPSRRESQQRPSGNGSANLKSTSLPHSRPPGTHRSAAPSVSLVKEHQLCPLLPLGDLSFAERILLSIRGKRKRGKRKKNREENLYVMNVDSF